MPPAAPSPSFAVRRLEPADAAAYRALRLRGVAEHAEAFTSSFEEDSVKLLTVTDGNDRARRLYEQAGFRSFGIEPAAIRIGDRYHGKNHMILFLTPP